MQGCSHGTQQLSLCSRVRAVSLSLLGQRTGRSAAGTAGGLGLRSPSRPQLPRRFPQRTFFFEPADVTSQILNFDLTALIDVQVNGVNRDANLVVAQKLRSLWRRWSRGVAWPLVGEVAPDHSARNQ
jgi:hypothetical protein